MATSADIFKRIEAMGLTLPPEPKANGGYDLVLVYGGLGYVSGQLPRTGNHIDELITGRAAGPEDVPRAQEAVRLCFLRSLLALHYHLGDLSAIDRLVSIKGFVNIEPGFKLQAKVLDAASTLARELFGSAGGHIRTALGVADLPSGGLVELELVVGVQDSWQPPAGSHS